MYRAGIKKYWVWSEKSDERCMIDRIAERCTMRRELVAEGNINRIE